MGQKKQIPKLRFRDDNGNHFTEWKRNSLSEFTTRITSKNEENNQNVLTISAQQGLINQLLFFNKSVSSKNLTGYYLLQRDDFAYNKSISNGYPFGAIKRLRLYNAGVVSPLYICFRVNNANNSIFIDYLFESGVQNKEIEKIAHEGARNHGLLNISIPDFFNISVSLPTLPEQKKIADFLSAIDERIQYLTKKKELLEQYKRGVMQKIFSQKLSFKDESGKPFPKWEKRKLSDILFEHKTRNQANLYTEVFSVAKTKGVINQVEHLGRSYAGQDTEIYKVAFPDDVIYTKSPTSDFPFGIIKQNKLKRTGIVSVLYAVFTPKNKYLGLLLDYYFSNWQNTFNYLIPIVQKGAKNTMNVNNDTFLNGNSISLPTSLPEQKKIADFLTAIDDKIEHVARQLEKTTEYKKGLLQQMFV